MVESNQGLIVIMLSLDHSCPSQICSSWNYLRKTWPVGQISILISAIGTTFYSPQKPSYICVRLYKTGDGTGLIRFYSNPFRGSSNLFQRPGGDSKWKSWQKLSWAQVPGFQFPNFQQQPWMSSKLLRGAKTLGFDNCILSDEVPRDLRDSPHSRGNWKNVDLSSVALNLIN